MNQKGKLNGLGRAGAILNIIFSIMIEILALILTIYFIIDVFILGHNMRIGDIILSMMVLGIWNIISISSIVLNIKVLYGNLVHKVNAVILGFLNLSLLGSIFLIFSKEETGEDPKVKKVDQMNEIKYIFIANELKKYKLLLDSRVISEEDYNQIKSKLLGGTIERFSD